MEQQLIETLQDVLEWIETGKVDGVGFDEQQIKEVMQGVLAKAES